MWNMLREIAYLTDNGSLSDFYYKFKRDLNLKIVYIFLRLDFLHKDNVVHPCSAYSR